MKKPKQKSYFRFAQIDVFGAIALCFVGTDLKQHERQFASFMSKFKGKRKPEYYWALFKDFKEKVPDIFPSSAAGAVIAPGSDPDVPIICIPEYKTYILVHEIVHAVANIMRNYGLEDGDHSEVRAYMPLSEVHGRNHGMTLEQILLIALGAILQSAILAIAYRIGKHNGYWTRVSEEKFARGIR